MELVGPELAPLYISCLLRNHSRINKILIILTTLKEWEGAMLAVALMVPSRGV